MLAVRPTAKQVSPRPVFSCDRTAPVSSLQQFVRLLVALAPWMALDSLVMVYLSAWSSLPRATVEGRRSSRPSQAPSFDFSLLFPSFRCASPTAIVITVGVMLFVGLVISELTSALRERDHAAVEHARRVAVLYSLTRTWPAQPTMLTFIRRASPCRAAVGRDVFFFRPTESAAPVLSKSARTFDSDQQASRLPNGIPPSAPRGTVRRTPGR